MREALIKNSLKLSKCVGDWHENPENSQNKLTGGDM